MAKDEKREKEPEKPAEAKRAEGPQANEGPRRLPCYLVEIPNCILGRKVIPAETPEQALETYKQLGGVTSHGAPAKVERVDETKTIPSSAK
jgi:hypothetical protein